MISHKALLAVDLMQGVSAMLAMTLMNWVIVILMMTVVGLWVITQLRLWRTHQGRHPSRSVTRAVWP
jgi:hypothetical protein